ncbi:PEP-CTERM sorting domain-containing protein [bacterium]|nr:MAG: PEP-CTERM sorting domain-containing protein [bacterium]
MLRLARSLPLVGVLTSGSAFAVFPDYGADTTYTSVGQVGGASGVAIDTRWVLTAQHVNGSVFSLPGFGAFNVVENIEPEIVNGVRPDLRLLRVDRDLPSFTRIDTRVPTLGSVDIVGFGESGSEFAGGGYSIPGGTAGTRRRASNRIEGLADISFNENPAVPSWTTMYYQLSSRTDPTRVENEGGLAGGDSGGGFFYNFGDGARLVATNSAIGADEGMSEYAYGGYGFGTYLGSPESLAFLQRYVPQAIAPQSPVPEPATLAVLGVGALAMLRRRRR